MHTGEWLLRLPLTHPECCNAGQSTASEPHPTPDSQAASTTTSGSSTKHHALAAPAKLLILVKKTQLPDWDGAQALTDGIM